MNIDPRKIVTKSITFFTFGETNPVMLRGYPGSALLSRITLVVLRESYGRLGIKPGSAVCKTNVLLYTIVEVIVGRSLTYPQV